MDEIKRDYVFHRDLTKKYPMITHGEGSYLIDEQGKKYLDGCSGAVAANLGHGITQIAEAMAEQARKAAFVHTFVVSKRMFCINLQKKLVKWRHFI